MRPAPVLFLLLVATTNCQPRNQPKPDPEPVQYTVPAEVEPYVQRFRDEMGKRGPIPATNNLIIRFGLTRGSDACGECALESGKTPRITLSPDAYCWRNASDYERECLVFHELGHCLLNRSHRTGRFPNNAYVSLMNPDDRAVYATCVYPIGNDVCDKRPRRDYYLDELANPATPTPAWGN